MGGDGVVGKTSLRRRYLGEGFKVNYQQTIGADFTVNKDMTGNITVKYVIWDLAGQLHFQEVRKAFYRGCQEAFLVCDISNPKSFENLEHWINELWKYSTFSPIPFIIAANKVDLEELGIPSLANEAIEAFANQISHKTMVKYGFKVKSIFTSAKTGFNVKDAFKQLAIQIFVHTRYLDKLYKPS